MKVTTPIKDTITFKLSKKDLTNKHCSEIIKTSAREVPFTKGLKWWIQCCPAGDFPIFDEHISLYLHVNQAVSIKAVFKVKHSSIQESFTHSFSEASFHACPNFATHEQLESIFVNGKLSIKCDVVFHVPIPSACWKPHIFRCLDDDSADFELVVGSNYVKVHKNFLALLSPVFNAMFSHDTAEVRTGRDVITDFDFSTVKAAIDFCYCKNLEDPTIETVIGILRFADKYDIKAIISFFEEHPSSNLSIDTLSVIAHYAFDCCKDNLFAECANFYKNNEKQIKTTDSFMELPEAVIAGLLQQAFGLETTYDVLCYARTTGYLIIMDYLERQLCRQLTQENYSLTISYAIDNSRADLQKACGKFFIQNYSKFL